MKQNNIFFRYFSQVAAQQKLYVAALVALLSSSAYEAEAQIGEPFIHDPSTIALCDGKYYTFGTGEGGLWSEDGWTWQGGAVRPGRGAAPDVLKIGDRYLIAYSATGGGLGGSHRGDVLTMWNKSLDPKSPDFKYTEPIVVASSLDDEDCDAIDAGLLLDPTTGRLWLSYGTCCDGPNSTYNIVVGRSRKITGPYVDNVGREMLQGGGKMVIAANNLKTGPGHFGRYIEEDGVEKMSFHYESDFRQGGRSVLAIRPLLWKNDWPVAGDEFHAGTYEIESERRGYALEIAVDFVRMQRDIEPFWIKPTKPLKDIEPQTLKEVEAEWPKGEVKVRMNDYMFRPHQKWSIMPAGKGGYLGGPYYKICIEGTTRYLTATAQHDVIAKPEFTGEDAQLWRIEQLTDGTYRIMPKAVPGTEEKLALVSLGDCTPGLAPFDFNSDNSKWNFRQQ